MCWRGEVGELEFKKMTTDHLVRPSGVGTARQQFEGKKSQFKYYVTNTPLQELNVNLVPFDENIPAELSPIKRHNLCFLTMLLLYIYIKLV